MPYMFVTLEVSRLSGWLNADARCRESKEGHAVRGEMHGSEGSRRGTTAAHAAYRRGRDCRLRAGLGEERTKNMRYMFVTLEVSRLSGWLNADASCRESIRRACGAGRGIRVRVQQAVDNRGARSVQERARL